MAESSLDSLRKTRSVSVERRAFELRPAEAPSLPPEVEANYRARILAGWPQVQAIARERFGLELKYAPEARRYPTRSAHAGAKYAEEKGQGEAYHLAVYRAYWQDLRDISSPDVLVEIVRDLGLDEGEFRAALTDDRYFTEVLADEAWAMQHGLSGVPAFIFGDRYLVSGAQPAEVLQRVVDRCLQEGL